MLRHGGAVQRVPKALTAAVVDGQLLHGERHFAYNRGWQRAVTVQEGQPFLHQDAAEPLAAVAWLRGCRVNLQFYGRHRLQAQAPHLGVLRLPCLQDLLNLVKLGCTAAALVQQGVVVVRGGYVRELLLEDARPLAEAPGGAAVEHVHIERLLVLSEHVVDARRQRHPIDTRVRVGAPVVKPTAPELHGHPGSLVLRLVNNQACDRHIRLAHVLAGPVFPKVGCLQQILVPGELLEICSQVHPLRRVACQQRQRDVSLAE
mmetsp:Transcript_29784/g.74969  ORF Transcript_29784/g.74969 Transcript_29784/m.74969 type:complete len:260 (-) Transcript_29784:415-1194(-)